MRIPLYCALPLWLDLPETEAFQLEKYHDMEIFGIINDFDAYPPALA